MSAPSTQGIDWQASEAEHPARTAARRSMAAVVGGAKQDWLSLFAEDGVVEDPVGPSMFDPEGHGHHGRAAIAAFWDASIAMVERFRCTIVDSFAAGSECANVGTITTFLPGGMRVDTEGVFVYRTAPTVGSPRCGHSGNPSVPPRHYAVWTTHNHSKTLVTAT